MHVRKSNSIIKVWINLLIAENELPEYAADALRLAAGNANLLLKKKMPRFAELVAKNLVCFVDTIFYDIFEC